MFDPPIEPTGQQEPSGKDVLFSFLAAAVGLLAVAGVVHAIASAGWQIPPHREGMMGVVFSLISLAIFTMKNPVRGAVQRVYWLIAGAAVATIATVAIIVTVTVLAKAGLFHGSGRFYVDGATSSRRARDPARAQTVFIASG